MGWGEPELRVLCLDPVRGGDVARGSSRVLGDRGSCGYHPWGWEQQAGWCSREGKDNYDSPQSGWAMISYLPGSLHGILTISP